MTKARDISKLSAVEVDADATDTTNVTSSGALMDSELTNLAAVKAINQSLVTTAGPSFGSLTVDTMSMNGSSLTATGDLMLDVAGYIELSSDDVGGSVYFSDGGTTYGRIYNSSSNLRIKSQIGDKSISFEGVDGSNPITALTLDMSNAGAATFGGNIIGSDELQLLQPNGTNNFGMELNNSHQVKYKARGSGGTHIFTNTTSDTERMRINSSGTLLIGKTSSSFSTVGQEFRAAGVTILGRDGGEPLTLNRTSSDGGIVNFNKDNSTVGSIGTDGGSLTIGGGDVGLGFYQVSDALVPINGGTRAARDNAIDLGTSGIRFKDLHLSGNMNAINAYLGNGNEIGWGGTYSQGKPTISGYNSALNFYPAGATSGLAMTLTSSGRLGIGWTAPVAPLDIRTTHAVTDVTSANTNSTIVVGNTAVGNGVYNAIKFAGNQQDMYIMSFNNAQQADRRLGFFLGSGAGDAVADERLSIRGDGKVGIGTTSPSRKLDVKGSVNFSVNTTSHETFVFTTQAANDAKLLMQNASSATAVQISANGDTYFNGGNVGIGTSSPSAKLHINGVDDAGATDLLRLTYDNSPADTGITFTDLNQTVKARLDMDASNTNDFELSVGADLRIYTGVTAASSANERLTILTGGNVGIGDSSPDRKLHVNSGATNVVAQFQSTDGTAAIELKDNAGTAEVAAMGNDLVIMPAGAERMRVAQAGTTTINGSYSTTNSVNYVLRLQSSSSGSAVAGHGTGIQFLGERNDGATQSLALIQAVTLTNSGSSIAAGLHFYTGSGGAPSERMSITSAGQFVMPGVYTDTTSDAANINVRSDGLHRRNTSSLRYKNTINDATHGLTELLALRPVTYKGNNDGDTVFGGLIAEEVHDAGLTEFVDYDSQNRPDALRYPHMISLCVKAIQEQQEVIESLTARITALEA